VADHTGSFVVRRLEDERAGIRNPAPDAMILESRVGDIYELDHVNKDDSEKHICNERDVREMR